ncbi:MAG: hypothetical protein ABI859_05255 [Pseudomonadota bacterium]
MEFLRYGHDAWGRELINGVSWDLLALAAGAGAVVVIGHFIYRLISGTSRRNSGN